VGCRAVETTNLDNVVALNSVALNSVALNGDIGGVARSAGAVGDPAAADQNVEY
jgi:hypothetical protein